MLVCFTSCTSGRWVVKDENAVDKADREILEQQKFLEVADSLGPDNPIFTLDLKSHTTYRYAQKLLVQRNIQDYRLRPGFVALGLAGAAASFYAANSSRFNSSSGQSLTLNAVGVLLAASGFANLKPVGDPRPVGEERYLEHTGSIIETDTVNIQNDDPSPANVSVTYRDRMVLEEDLESIPEGQIQVPLASSFNDLQLKSNDPGSFEITVNYNDSTYHYSYPVSVILEPYARITTDLTELRSKPVIYPDNVLADLTQGSQVKVDTMINDQWYRVLYGISEYYIQKDDAEMIWISTNFSGNEKVVAVPRVPFGNIDVESNIPNLRKPAPNALALIITNENYDEPLSTRQNTHRDGRLVEEYLKEALGYQTGNIFHLTDVRQPDVIYRQIDKISKAANDSTEIFVYLAGYGEIRSEQELYYKNVAPTGEAPPVDVSLRSIYSRVASVSSSNTKTFVVADIDFDRTLPDKMMDIEKERILRSHAAILTDKPGTVLLMSSGLGQPSRLYRSSAGEDKKHHIFPYFFARALQQKRTTVSNIYDYLQQNISYTSRRLHDRPQESLIFGDRSLSFIDP